MPIHTDGEINASRPDIVIKDKRERRCKIIDVVIPSDNNTSVKVAEKLSKYKDLEIETSWMWDMKTDTTPVVIGALIFVKKGLERNTNNIPTSSKSRSLPPLEQPIYCGEYCRLSNITIIKS